MVSVVVVRGSVVTTSGCLVVSRDVAFGELHKSKSQQVDEQFFNVPKPSMPSQLLLPQRFSGIHEAISVSTVNARITWLEMNSSQLTLMVGTGWEKPVPLFFLQGQWARRDYYESGLDPSNGSPSHKSSQQFLKLIRVKSSLFLCDWVLLSHQMTGNLYLVRSAVFHKHLCEPSYLPNWHSWPRIERSTQNSNQKILSFSKLESSRVIKNYDSSWVITWVVLTQVWVLRICCSISVS